MQSPAPPAAVGIDLGGTKIEAIVLDQANVVRARLREPTARGTPEGIVEQIARLAERVTMNAGFSQLPVGIGTPGSISPTRGTLRNSNTTELNGFRFREALEARLGPRVRIANDANCFALSESRDGAGKDAKVVFGLILGTGVGGGIVVHGHLIQGANGVGGEWGHSPLPWPKYEELDLERHGDRNEISWTHDGSSARRMCYCGKNGCLETFLSGPALESDFIAEKERSDPSTVTTGRNPVSAADIVTLAEQGDAVAEGALRRYEDRLGRALAATINLLDPDVIVFGGGLSNVARFRESAVRGVHQWVFSDSVATRFVAPFHGDASGVRGAAALWLTNMDTSG